MRADPCMALTILTGGAKFGSIYAFLTENRRRPPNGDSVKMVKLLMAKMLHFGNSHKKLAQSAYQ